MAEKLKALKIKLKCWNKEVFERVKEKNINPCRIWPLGILLEIKDPWPKMSLKEKPLRWSSKSGLCLRRSCRDKNLGKSSLRKVTKIQGFFIKWKIHPKSTTMLTRVKINGVQFK